MKTIPRFTNDEQERAWRPGEIPVDGPESEPTLRSETADARKLCLSALAKLHRLEYQLQLLRNKQPGAWVDHAADEMLKLAKRLEIDVDALKGAVNFIGQLAENLEVRQ
jgi:hypothetical protein